MSQDTKTFLGFVVIALIVLVWMTYFAPKPKVEPKIATADSTQVHQETAPQQAAPAAAEIPDSLRRSNTYGNLFAAFTTGAEKQITVHTSLYTAVVSSHGGALKQFELSNFKTYNNYPVEMIDGSRSSQLNLLFESSDGKLVSTGDLFFAETSPSDIELHGDSTIIAFKLAIDSSRSIEKRFTFHDGTYLVDAEFIFTNCATVIGNYHYQITWDNGVPYAEGNSVDESNSAESEIYMNGEYETIDAAKVGEQNKKNFSGITNWVATRNKYFAAAMIAPSPADGGYLQGMRVALPDNGAREDYTIALQFPYKKNAVESTKVKVYIGPLDYKIVKGLDVDLERIMSFGWAWVIRPIGIYFMMPVFNFIHMFIPNYGFVIIIFSIFIKAILTPLGLGQMKSAKKMQLMQPMMAEMKLKYKDDPTKMNAETMKLYSTYGINPLGGCLPMLLQMPILYAMWALLRNSIQLRQSGFALWITDLSVPDVALKLPFTIPYFGITQLSGLAILMGAAIFLQQRMTTISDPRQKTMMYFMPVLFTLMFMSFPSGLNLYYLMFNLLSIGQQFYFNKRHSEIKLVPVKKENGKGGSGKQTFTQRVLAAQAQAGKQNGKAKRK